MVRRAATAGPPAWHSPGTREQLVDAARGLLIEHGLSGVSMRRVASACGLTAAAIYRHFPDKDSLLSAAVLEGFRMFGSYLLDALEMGSPRDRFRHICQRYFDFSREHRHHYQLIFMTDCARLGLTRLDDTAQQEISGTFQLLQDRVAECQAAELFVAGDSRALAASVWASVHGLASLIITGQLDMADTDDLIRLHLDQIERGLRPHT